VNRNYRLKEGKLIQTTEVDLSDMTIEVVEGGNRPRAIICIQTDKNVDFEGDAERLFKWLHSTVPSGTVDRLYDKLYRYNQENG
jgi:hypothetical protein